MSDKDLGVTRSYMVEHLHAAMVPLEGCPLRGSEKQPALTTCQLL